ncbi:LysR substrate-binding domain-containing protein [Pelagicoccus mobilis]|uniref:LysR family transcriptional regulator n=1 Tax=Pelagicoccus mobilis TaxID=415221 RepID=A0A934S5Z9_9BACT|nr:LysR substrate-binding domain-containing protein [Pelagicoccus mobilis]MBK1880014.1 LysR family transcriptional regulator [Pelagicoccus mobilis]
MEVPSHRQVLAFLEVCRDFHFSMAAERLGVAQPQLSRTVRELEEIVGTKLFVRQGRRVSLSAAGDVFLKEVYRLPAILARAVEGARRAAEGEESVLRLGFVGALMGDQLLAVLELYRKEHPDTQLSLVDLAPADLLRQVETGEIDGAFLGVEPKSLPRGVASFQWKEEPLLVCVPRGHRLAERKRLRIGDLEGETLVVLTGSLAPSYRDFLDGLFAKEGARIDSLRETNGSDAILSMVVAGCGVALLPRSALKAAGDRVAAIPVVGAEAKLREVFLYRPAESDRLGAMLSLLKG